jgi:hypothetical protein
VIRRYRLWVRKLPVLLGFALALAAAPRASAQVDAPRAGGIPDLVGARGLALGAYRGISPGNDGIYTNAAALAARRRYSIETQWFLERQGADPALQVLTGSVVDSESSVTGGFSYGRALSGPYIGNLFHLPIAFAASDGFFLGATAKYLSVDGPAGEQVRSADVDASAYWRATSTFSLGASGYNLVDAGHRRVLPRGVGAGASFGDDRRFHLAVDWRGDWPRQGKMTNLYAVGGELLLGDYVPVRASWLRDETRNASFWSAGVGLVTTGGFALDASYRQGIDDASNRVFALAVKLFLLN